MLTLQQKEKERKRRKEKEREIEREKERKKTVQSRGCWGIQIRCAGDTME
jgi:hypothetical protein